jgi:non-heme chloroperoxidase
MKRARGLGAVAAGAGLGAAYALERSLARRWRASEEELTAAGLWMPSDLDHHFVTTGDGARIHTVEAGEGPPIVLIHGITLGVGVWARQFSSLRKHHRVLAIDLRGHGPSIGGSGGYSFERLADDVLEVLAEREVADAVVVGHSMGGMVLQLAAIRRVEALRRHAVGLVLVATDAGPTIPGPVGRPMGMLTARVAWRAARYAERHSKGVYPGSDLATWGSRVCFGARPRAVDVELVRSLSSAVPPRAMAELLTPLMEFDVRIDLPRIDLPTLVVVGSRDVLTPARRARFMASRIPGARLEVLPGCGHLVMLERPAELDALIEDFSAELVA